MRKARRSTIATLMWGVALVAFLLGCAQTEAGQLFLLVASAFLPVGLIFARVRRAPRSRRGMAFTWIASAWPLVPCVWVHVCWLAALVQLGRPPAMDEQLPSAMIAAQGVLFSSCGLTILSPFAVIFGTIVWDHPPTGRHDPSRPSGLPVLVMFVMWVVAILITQWDPVGAIYWGMYGF